MLFKIAELKTATNNFSRASKIGEDIYGSSIYKGVIKSLEFPFHEIHVAVKYEALQRLKEWVTRMDFLEVVEHPNIVKLVGYCVEYHGEIGTQLFFVYEYYRSLRDHLSTSSLSWTMRLKVAKDVASALVYLQEEMEIDQNDFEDFKSSNILLDDECNAKISDLGLVRLGPRGRLARMAGYMDLEYIPTTHLTSRSNVWIYGVLLCELITGRRTLDKTRPKKEQKLVEWVKPYLDSKNVHQIVDLRLVGEHSLESVRALATIANKCLSENHESRPMMSEVLEMVKQIIEGPLQATNLEIPFKSTIVRDIAIKLKKLCMCTTKVYKE